RLGERGNRLRGDLDSSGGSLELMALRVATEVFEQHVVALGRRQLDEPFGPELLEARESHALGSSARANAIVHPLAPAHLVAVFGERALVSEALRERAENIEVVLRLANGIDGLMHRENERVTGGAADVVALEKGGGGKHDIAVTRGCCPPALVHDYRFRLLPGAAQPIEILMVMEGIAAGPIDQANVGKRVAAAVEAVARAGREEQGGTQRP